MDEARRVIERLGRIDALRSAGADPRAVLVELRELVQEGREWASLEGSGAARASAALDVLESSFSGRRSGSLAARGQGSCRPR